VARKQDFANQELRRETIFSATFKVIFKKGISKLTVNSVAKEAGVSTTLIHYYFKDKETLLVEFVEALFGKFRSFVERRYEPSDPTQTKLEAFFAAGREFIEEQKDLFIVLIEVWCYCIRDPQLKKAFAKVNRETSDVMVKIMDEGIEKGVFNKVKKETLSGFYLAFVLGTGVLLQLDNQFLDTEEQFGIVTGKVSELLMSK
jgi:AcrR family transcriptional regulator